MKDKFKLYKIGGCVRDKLMGVKSKDIDYVFVFQEIDKNVTPENYFLRMEKCLLEMGVKIHITKPDCFTIRGKFNDEDVDYVMARKESYPNPESRIPIVEMGDLYADQLRRDFTCNAIAEDEDGLLIDPFGGQADLRKGILRCPISAQTSFNDDPLRMLRALRFSITKNFTMDASIERVILKDQEMWVKFINVVSEERIREEVYKMFKHDTIKTLRLLSDLEKLTNISVLKYIFGENMWLEPTTKKRK
jgi:tRNA nucleotidyltransferase/poly(A) polymerase